MKKLNKVLFVSLLSLFVIGTAHAQITKSPAADADKAFNTFQYVEAAQLYKKAYSKVRRNPVEKRRIMFQMAECYTLTHNLKMAEKQYLKLEKVNYQKDNPLIFLRLGDCGRISRRHWNTIKSTNSTIQTIRAATTASNRPHLRLSGSTTQPATKWRT